jgi:hypothetical protein
MRFSRLGSGANLGMHGKLLAETRLVRTSTWSELPVAGGVGALSVRPPDMRKSADEPQFAVFLAVPKLPVVCFYVGMAQVEHVEA